jgi:ATP-binding cassette, subfamily B, bacterial MsbA
MKLAGFLSHYLRRYWRWALVAAVATVVYAAATVMLIPLIQAIFGEVLHYDGRGLPGSVAGIVRVEGAPATATNPPQEGTTGSRTGAVGPAAGESGPASMSKRAKVFLDRYLNEGFAALKRALGVRPSNVIYFVPLVFVVVFVGRSLSDFLNGYAFQKIGLGATTDLRNDLYSRTLEQSSRFHAEHPSGELVSRVVHDVGVLQSAISTRLVDLVQQSVTLVALLVLLFSIQFRLALFCLVATPAILWPIVRFSKGMRRTSHRAQERTADLANLVGEGSRGHRVVKAFGMEEFELSRFRVATRRHLAANLRGQLLANLSSPVVETLGVIGAGAFLVFAGRRIQAGTMDAATLISFLFNLYLLYDPIRKMNKANMVVQQSLAAAQRIRHLMTLPVEIVDRPGAREVTGLERSIRYRDVCFRYDHREVLRGVDFEVRRGEVVAFVGPSGGGKTTLVNLLPRFFDVTDGAIELDGTDIRDLRLASLRGLIGLVTQETVLFDDTVRNNIAYGRADLPLERVRSAARTALADDFILELPHGYDTVVGESGSRLSGGQRQRLAIARALLKDAPILILDEATSQLDSESEALVQEALANLMRGRTTLVIAHRLSTIKRADHIYVLDAGRVVEQGTHDELLDFDGLYRHLHDLQFQD